MMRPLGAAVSFGAPALVAAALAACDLPTSAPIIENTWVVPVATDTIRVAELLPAGMTATSGEFLAASSGATTPATLGALCSACAALDGTNAPKPAFTGAVAAEVALPAGLTAARVGAGAAVEVQVANQLGFDPIRPGPAARGRIVLGVLADGVLVGADTVLGEDTAFPSGGLLEASVPLTPGATIGSRLLVSVTLDSPAGDPVQIDTDSPFAFEALPGAVRVAEADVVVRDEPVRSSSTRITFTDLDDGVVERSTGATVELRFENPVAVTGELTVHFESAGAPVAAPRPVPLAEGSSVAEVELDRTEIQAILDSEETTVRLSGLVSGTAGGQLTTLRPSDELRVRARVHLHTTIGD